MWSAIRLTANAINLLGHTVGQKQQQKAIKSSFYAARYAELPSFIQQKYEDILMFDTQKWTKEEMVQQIIAEREDQSKPFNVVDLRQICNQYHRWTTNLPNIVPYYAVKSCPDPMVIQLLNSLGCGFDCASKNELAQAMKFSVPSQRVIYANPIKAPEYLEYAAENSVNAMTFDSEEELFKIKELHPKAELVLRIKTDDSNSACQFSTKFGASMDDIEQLVAVANRLGLNLVGVSFHVGSGCRDADSFEKAIRDAKTVFNVAKAKGGYNMSLLDIGGGFPGVDDSENASFEEMSDMINGSVDKYFGKEIEADKLKVIAEPGRYFCTSSHTLACKVIGKKAKKMMGPDGKEAQRKYIYYMNDGVYGSFNCIMFDYAKPVLKRLGPGIGSANDSSLSTSASSSDGGSSSSSIEGWTASETDEKLY
jgi:ornithine decarboxylase